MSDVLKIVPAEVNLRVMRGTDNTIEFTLTDADEVAIDITNDTVKFTARDAYAGTVKIATKTNAPGGHSTPAGGKTRFKILRTEIDDEAAETVATTWLYEVRRILAGSSDEILYFQGELKILPAVTRQ